MDTAERIMAEGRIAFASERSGMPDTDGLAHFRCRYVNEGGATLEVPFSANFEPDAPFVLQCLAADLAQADGDVGALNLDGDDEAETLDWLAEIRGHAEAVLGEGAVAALLADASVAAAPSNP